MALEYPSNQGTGDRRQKNDLGIGSLIDNLENNLNQQTKNDGENATTSYQANIDVMYYTVFCGVSSYFDLNPIETAVLSFVCSFHRNKMYCYASKELMARVARTSSVTVFKALKKLKTRKLIEQVYHNGKVCLLLGPEAIDRWKYVDKIIKAARDEKKKPKNELENIW